MTGRYIGFRTDSESNVCRVSTETYVPTGQSDSVPVDYSGGAQGRQRFVISMIDPASRWVYSEIAPQRLAPTPQDSRAVVINGLLSLRDGILEHTTMT